MAFDRLRRGLRQFGAEYAADRADDALRRSCIGRIVNMLAGLFIVGCLLIWILLYVLVSQTGLLGRFEGPVETVLGVAMCGTFVFAIVAAGLIGHGLRRLIWRRLLRRRR